MPRILPLPQVYATRAGSIGVVPFPRIGPVPTRVADSTVRTARATACTGPSSPSRRARPVRLDVRHGDDSRPLASCYSGNAPRFRGCVSSPLFQLGLLQDEWEMAYRPVSVDMKASISVPFPFRTRDFCGLEVRFCLVSTDSTGPLAWICVPPQCWRRTPRV